MSHGLRIVGGSNYLLDEDTRPYTYIGMYQATIQQPFMWSRINAVCATPYGQVFWEIEVEQAFATHYVLISKAACPSHPLVFIELDATIIAGLSRVTSYDDNNWIVGVYQTGGYAKLHVYGVLSPAAAPTGYGLALYDAAGSPLIGDAFRPPIISRMDYSMDFRPFQLSGNGSGEYIVSDFNDTAYSPSGLPSRVLLSANALCLYIVEVEIKDVYTGSISIKGFRLESGVIWARGASLKQCNGYGDAHYMASAVIDSTWAQDIMIADGAGLP